MHHVARCREKISISSLLILGHMRESFQRILHEKTKTKPIEIFWCFKYECFEAEDVSVIKHIKNGAFYFF
jgi:hypothetical protein